jgi:hypothetical protein
MATFLRRDDWVTDAMGNAISGASVYVCSQPATTGSIPPSPLVQLYADSAGVTPITQPVMTDGYGHAFFYVTPGTYTIVYYSPQILEQVLPDQTIGAGNVAFPITIADGGTNATTASQALINLGAAASGANADITSLAAIPETTLNGSGYSFGTAGIVATIGLSGGESFIGLTQIGGSTSLTSAGLTTGSVNTGTFNATSNVNLTQIVSNVPGSPVEINNTGSGASTPNVVLLVNGASVATGKGLLGFVNYNTQTTVGAAGGASALPATPTIYLQLNVNGTVYLFPGYTV